MYRQSAVFTPIRKIEGWRLLSTSMVFIITMILLDSIDYDLTLFLHENRPDFLGNFMRRSLFEGEGFGAGDPVIIFLLIAAIGYYLTLRFPDRIGHARRFRPHFGFIITTSLFSAIMMVHSLKWILGRTRPYLVLNEGLPYSAWFEFGHHFVTQGVYRGSFPSGHTAQACLLISLCYVLTGDLRHRIETRVFGWFLVLLVLGYTVTMGTYRCMFLSHWATDVVGAVGLTILYSHMIYHNLLKVPAQMAYFRKHGTFADMPLGFELYISIYLFGVVLGFMGIALGTRGLLRGEGLIFGLLILAGGLLCTLMFQRVMSHQNRFVKALATPPES
ncbi:MAG: phosphatase PAP2 family protein [Desulfobacteraceae bacterium]|nr:MAG: phosphatase PAP2 family protein [Desulfobacteraceae bacterium]